MALYLLWDLFGGLTASDLLSQLAHSVQAVNPFCIFSLVFHKVGVCAEMKCLSLTTKLDNGMCEAKVDRKGMLERQL